MKGHPKVGASGEQKSVVEDETELIARGVHRLHVIRVAGFAKRVRQKTLPRWA